MSHCRVIAYIDGFNLYHGLQAIGWTDLFWLNLQDLMKAFLRPDEELAHTWYFTSPVLPTAEDPDKPTRQDIFLQALATLDNFGVIKGQYVLKKPRCSHCSTVNEFYVEKTTDVALGSRLITDAVQDRCDLACIVASDSDVVPAISAMREVAPKTKVRLLLPPKRGCKELSALCDETVRMVGRRGSKKRRDAHEFLRRHVFPVEIQDSGGRTIRCPEAWDHPERDG